MKRKSKSWMLFVWLALSVGLALACRLSSPFALLLATPTPTPTPTVTPSPTITPTVTPSPTPTPTWQRTRSWRVPEGRYLYAGALSPDGRYIFLASFAHPEQRTATPGPSTPVFHLLRTDTMELLWEGPLSTKAPIEFTNDLFWLPDNETVVLTSQTGRTVYLVLWSARDKQVRYERKLDNNSNAMNYAAYDGVRDLLLLREWGRSFLTGYTFPEMKPSGRYLLEPSNRGCCDSLALASSPYGVLALLWGRRDNGLRLAVWDGSDTSKGRLLSLPYRFPDVAPSAVVWGPKDRSAFIFGPGTENSSLSTFTWVVVDMNTGDVLWTLWSEEAWMIDVAWLENEGWLIGMKNGGIRLYSDSSSYQVLRRGGSTGGFLMQLSTIRGKKLWLAVMSEQAEIWEWK